MPAETTRRHKRHVHLRVADKLALRRSWAFSPLRLVDIAQAYGVSVATVSNLVAGLTRHPAGDDAEVLAQLRQKFLAESGCRTDASWLAAWQSANERHEQAVADLHRPASSPFDLPHADQQV